MSRDLQNQQGYHGDRRLPKPQTRNDSFYSTDPARYDSRTANNDGWYGQRPFGGPLPYRGKDHLEPVRIYREAPPNLLPTTPLDGGNSGRSVQNTRHVSRSDERASQRHGPTAHGAPKPRRSEGRDSEHSGKRGISHPDASHASTSNTSGKLPPRWHHYSEQEQLTMIECVKARMNWHEIGKKLKRSNYSVKTHWYSVLAQNHRARGVKYNPINKE